MKFEIDMLNVGAADAILLRFFEGDVQKVVLADAGNYSDGKMIADFVKNRYNTHKIDLAICTHCDKDHYGGFIYLCEQMRDYPSTSVDIETFLINDPGKHISSDDVKYYRSDENVIKEARSVYDLDGKNLLTILYDLQDKEMIDVQEAFSDKNFHFLNNRITIVGPTQTFYEELVPSFRNALQPYDTDDDIGDAFVDSVSQKVFSKTLDEVGDDSSTHNQSSIMFTFKPDDESTYFFMGDAGRMAFDRMLKVDQNSVKRVSWLKVPHHGSKKNLDNVMINWIHPQVAYVSTEKYTHYLSRAVVSALKKCGCNVYSTHKGSGPLWYHEGTSLRADYSTAVPL